MSADVSAQSTETRWSGTNVDNLSKATNGGTAGVTGGEWFFLYNVGTGKFLINGGDWGAEGRLFYDDWGKMLKYTNDGLIYTGMETATNAWFWGANVPKVTSTFDWGSDETFYTLMDTRKTYSGSNTRNLIFTRVENSGNTYTYYISENLGGNTYYLGGAWGEFRDETDTSRDHGSFVFIDDDRAVWTSDNVTTKTNEVEIFGGTTVSAKELYQWRIVTLTQFEAQVLGNSENAYGGLNANVSYRITDQDFSRNVAAFFNGVNAEEPGWNVTSKATEGNGRYKYTFGWVNKPIAPEEDNYCDHLSTGTRYVNEAWDTPVRLKEQFVGYGPNHWYKKDCKNGYLSFEGTGTVSTWITAPATGYYQVKCVGFSQSTNSSNNHRGYLFASANNATSGVGYAQTYLYQMPAGTYDRTTYAQTLAVGNELRTTQDGGTYQSMVQIYATQGQRIYIGVGKDASTQSEPDVTSGGTTTTYCYITYTSDGTTYYLNHNARFVAVDGEPTSDYQWLLQRYNDYSDYYYVYYMNGTSQTWLVANYNNNSASTSTSTSNRLYYYNGRIVDDRNDNYNTYYLKGTTSSTTAPSVTSGTSGAATARTETVTTGGTNYYHDTDWVAVDNFQIVFLGDQGPVIFDEDENTSLDYLKSYNNNEDQFDNRTVWLKRTMMQNQWNSFVFPLDLTNAQVRNVFGDDAKLAKLHSLGKLSGDPGIIDFQSVNLGSDGTAITAGDFYIIQPTKAPTTNVETGEKYYTIGRRTFTLSALPATHSTTVTDESGNLHISAYATYVNGGQAPIHSYVLGTKSGEDEIFMYYLSKPTNMKGFRGYLIDEDGALGSKSADIFLGGFFDDETLYIDGLHNHKPTNDGYIYDMMGRKVGKANETSTGNLPKGLYIMNGKKFIVK